MTLVEAVSVVKILGFLAELDFCKVSEVGTIGRKTVYGGFLTGWQRIEQ
jgi:hypothetical protein